MVCSTNTGTICASNCKKVIGGCGHECDGVLITPYTERITEVRECESGEGVYEARVTETKYVFRTDLSVPRSGVMVVGIGGNNGTTLSAGIVANRMGLSWETKHGLRSANWYGSMAQAGTVKLGNIKSEDKGQGSFFLPIRSLLPMVNPNDLIIGGWDVSDLPMSLALKRARVLPVALQQQVAAILDREIKILPSAFDENFVARNQSVRATHIIRGTKGEQLEKIRQDIRTFKKDKSLDKVIIFWSANTERFAKHTPEVHGSTSSLIDAINANHPDIPPSLLYATAACIEGCSFINGSPQNTFCEGLIELARSKGVFLIGDDLKTGQTKLKSVMAEFLISTALKPTSIVSYNHLGNNDGLNLSSEEQFKSKEISKASVVEDMVTSNKILYPKESDHPDHLIVIKYVKSVGDSKRALDEYSSDIFMNGQQTIVIHNTCEDSLLAVPIMMDLILFSELFGRITVADGTGNPAPFHPLLSSLSLFVKAPQVPSHAPVVNGLFQQREALLDLLKVVAGFTPTDHISMRHRLDGTEDKENKVKKDMNHEMKV